MTETSPPENPYPSWHGMHTAWAQGHAAAMGVPRPVGSDSMADVHLYFGLTYANMLVLHRSILQSMPTEWQYRFVACLQEMDDRISPAMRDRMPDAYQVRAKAFDGRYVRDTIPHYNRGRTVIDFETGDEARWCQPCNRHHGRLHTCDPAVVA